MIRLLPTIMDLYKGDVMLVSSALPYVSFCTLDRVDQGQVLLRKGKLEEKFHCMVIVGIILWQQKIEPELKRNCKLSSTESIMEVVGRQISMDRQILFDHPWYGGILCRKVL